MGKYAPHRLPVYLVDIEQFAALYLIIAVPRDNVITVSSGRALSFNNDVCVCPPVRFISTFMVNLVNITFRADARRLRLAERG